MTRAVTASFRARARSISIAALVCVAAFVAGCGSPSSRSPQQAQEPRPKIGLLMDTLDERWQRDRDLFLERAQQLDADVLVEAAERDDAGTAAVGAIAPRPWRRSARRHPAQRRESGGDRRSRQEEIGARDQLRPADPQGRYRSTSPTTTRKSVSSRRLPAQPGTERQLHPPRWGADRPQREADSRRADERARGCGQARRHQDRRRPVGA